MSKQTPIVILSTADFDAPVWTNKQHIASRLATNRKVIYIESLGLRAPRLTLQDMRRIFVRLGSFLFRQKRGSLPYVSVPHLEILSPFVLPWHGSRLVRKINQFLIKRSILYKLPNSYVLWSFSPLTYGLEENAEAMVYHSVDLLHTLPGLPSEALLEAERGMVERSNVIVASSRGVLDHLQSLGASVHLWENVADVDLFKAHWAPVRERRAIFVGNLTQTKINFSILERIVQLGVRLAVAGPSRIDGTERAGALDRLFQSELVEDLGLLSQEAMALELGRSWIGIIPYQLNEYTKGVFPMKVYEYLAAGLPVVATPMTSLTDTPIEGLELVDVEQFADRVFALCSNDHQPPKGTYASNSWTARLAQVEALIDDISQGN